MALRRMNNYFSWVLLIGFLIKVLEHRHNLLIQQHFLVYLLIMADRMQFIRPKTPNLPLGHSSTVQGQSAVVVEVGAVVE